MHGAASFAHTLQYQLPVAEFEYIWNKKRYTGSVSGDERSRSATAVVSKGKFKRRSYTLSNITAGHESYRPSAPLLPKVTAGG